MGQFFYVFSFFRAGAWDSARVIGALPVAVVRSNDCPGAITRAPVTPFDAATTYEFWKFYMKERYNDVFILLWS